MLKRAGIKKEVVYFGLFISMLIFIIMFRGKTSKYIPRGEKESKQTIIKNMEKIKDNYTLNISLSKQEEEYKLDYMTDSNVKMYSSDTFKVVGYLIYNDKYYQLNNNELKKTKSLDINGIFNEKYYNLELIKNIVDKCSYKDSSLIRYICDVKLSDYFEEYNKIYNTEIKPSEDKMVEFEFLYDDTKIRSIKINYTNVVKELEKNDEEIIYNIDINNINKNDFSEYTKYIEKNN